MWDVLLCGAVVGALLWGLINSSEKAALSSENVALRERLAKFERPKDAKGRFVKRTPLESFLAGPEPEEIYTEWEGMNDGR